MKKYIYEAYSQTKGISKGEMNALNKDELRKKLQNEELILIRCYIKKEKKLIFQLNKIKNRDLIDFTYQLSVMLESGISVKKSLEIQKKSSKNKKIKNLIESILKKISQGGSFKEGVIENSKIFKPIYINVVSFGEITGTLHLSLKNLSDRLEQNEKIEKEVKKALIYPITVLITTIFLVLFLLIFILPEFIQGFQQDIEKLPQLTKIMLKISQNIKNYFLVIFIFFLLVGFFIKKICALEKIKEYTSYIVLKLPYISNLYKKYHVLKVLSGIYILLKSGISLLKTLDLIMKEEKNIYLNKEILEIKNNLKIGKTLESALKKSLFFDDLTLTLISIGEKSGNLLEMLEKNIEILEDRLKENLRYFITVLEPFLMIILGVVIGSILLGIYLPIFNIENYIG